MDTADVDDSSVDISAKVLSIMQVPNQDVGLSAAVAGVMLSALLLGFSTFLKRSYWRTRLVVAPIEFVGFPVLGWTMHVSLALGLIVSSVATVAIECCAAFVFGLYRIFVSAGSTLTSPAFYGDIGWQTARTISTSEGI